MCVSVRACVWSEPGGEKMNRYKPVLLLLLLRLLFRILLLLLMSNVIVIRLTIV